MRVHAVVLLISVSFALSGALPVPAQLFGRRSQRNVPWDLHAYMAAGASNLNLDDLNDRLEAAGYSPFSTTFVSLSGGVHFSVRRLIFGWEGSALLTDGESSVNNDIATEIVGGEGIFNVGYKIVSRDNFSLYPMVGVGAGAMQLSFLPATGVSFGDILTDPRQMARINAFTALVDVGAGLEYLVPVFRFWGANGGILLGLRAGYRFSPVSSNWRFENDSIPGGPDLDMSGAYARAMFGIGVRSTRNY